MKSIVRVILLLFVAGSVTYLVINEYVPLRQEVGTKHNEQVTTSSQAQRHEAIVYYFHGTRRCVTCRTIESYIAESLKTYFSDDLAAGTLSWEPINVDEPWNNHFIEEYNITTSTAVIADMRDAEKARYKKLDRVWELVRDKPAFMEYIRSETESFLRSGGGDE